MDAAPELSPLLSYTVGPLLFALGLLLLAITWVSIILWTTRRKPEKSLRTLPAAPALAIDYSQLKARYIEQINIVQGQFDNRDIPARTAHQQLSSLLKSFVAEAARVPVRSMTLSELKRTRYKPLSEAIDSYYRPEFAAVESGSVASAAERARKVVTEWS